MIQGRSRYYGGSEIRILLPVDRREGKHFYKKTTTVFFEGAIVSLENDVEYSSHHQARGNGYFFANRAIYSHVYILIIVISNHLLQADISINKALHHEIYSGIFLIG